nr:DUF4276 family protein [Azospirillum oleiclasticum]
MSVEGATERAFVQSVLAPHLQAHGLYTTPVSLDGNVSLDRLRHELPRLAPAFDAISTMYDFHGFKRRGDRSPSQLEDAIRSICPTIIPYIQVHDFEALLFSHPDITAAALRDSGRAQELHAIRSRYASPEEIDSRPECFPKARLHRLFPRYDPVLHGPSIAERITLATLRAECPRFHAWVARLESLGAVERREPSP